MLVGTVNGHRSSQGGVVHDIMLLLKNECSWLVVVKITAFSHSSSTSTVAKSCGTSVFTRPCRDIPPRRVAKNWRPIS